MESNEKQALDPEILNLHSKIAFVVGSYYPNWFVGEVRNESDTDKVRGNLGLKTMKEATDLGYSLVVTDGGSSPAFWEEAKRLGIDLIKREGKGRGAGRRQGYEKAAAIPGVDVIFWTEAEKVSIVRDCADIAAAPILAGEVDVVVPKRNDLLFQKTYPNYMYESELVGNTFYNGQLRKFHLYGGEEDLDMYFGPKIFRNDPALLEIFTEEYETTGDLTPFQQKYLDPEEGSDTNFFPIVEALAKGYKVRSVEVPFEYPSEQKRDEEVPENIEKFKEKRKGQRMELSDELIHFLRMTFRSPKAKIKAA